jgi:photosystem II stability/assembly factor-like uncharacterized protein
MKKLILFSFSILASSILLSQWEIQSPYPTNYLLNDVEFIDQNVGWTCGKGGTILYTVDGGENWIHQDSPFGGWLYNMAFISDQHGWIVGDLGTILSTSDEGQNWEIIYTSDTIQLKDIEFMNLQMGWTVGSTNSGKGIILQTKDSGINWEIQFYDTSNFTTDFNDLVFTSANSGWVIGDHGILHTNDGGQTWAEQYTNNLSSFESHISFIDSLNGWASGSGAVLLNTNNGGESWMSDTVISNYPLSISDIYFLDGMNGWILCASGEAGGEWHYPLYTTDGGINWMSCLNFPYRGTPYSMCFSDATTGWIVGSFGGIGHTTNGLNWNMQSHNTNIIRFTDVCFFDDQNGWALGNSYDSFMTCWLLQSNNGGENWEINPDFNFDDWLQKIYKIDDNNLWITGEYLSYQTKDGGESWQSYDFGSSYTNDFFFTDVQNGWNVSWEFSPTNGSKVYHTSDEGESWEEQYTGIGEYLTSLYFIDQNIGWVVGNSGDSGIILHTINAGISWNIQAYEDNQNFIEVYFYDINFGLTFSNYGSVFKTSNGGEDWIQINEGFEVDFSDVFGVDTNNIWAIGSIGQYPQPVFEGLIYHSNDGGKTWTEQESGTTAPLNSIWLNDTNNGWIVGERGTILHTETGGIGWINDFPIYHSSFKVYPNPSFSSITIELSRPPSDGTYITISSINGKKVISQRIPDRKTEIDISSLPAGIYIIKVWNDKNVMVQKVIKQ